MNNTQLNAGRVDIIQDAEHQAVFRNVGHRGAIVLVTNITVFINDHHRRNPAKLEQVPFLIIYICNCVLWIRQPDKGQFLGFPITFEGVGSIRTNRQNHRVTRGKGLKIIAHAREMGPTVGSHKTAQKDEKNIFFAAKTGQTDFAASQIVQLKIWSCFQFFNHVCLTFSVMMSGLLSENPESPA